MFNNIILLYLAVRSTTEKHTYMKTLIMLIKFYYSNDILYHLSRVYLAEILPNLVLAGIIDPNN